MGTRIALDIDDDLLAEVRAYADATGRSLSAVVEEALREASTRRRGVRRRGPVKLPTFSGWVRRGVNIDSNAELLDLMEEDDLRDLTGEADER